MFEDFPTFCKLILIHVDSIRNYFLYFQEDYQDLPLVVQDSPNLKTSLANLFTIHEPLTGENQYRCSSCSNNLCDAEKVNKIMIFQTKTSFIQSMVCEFLVGENK